MAGSRRKLRLAFRWIVRASFDGMNEIGESINRALGLNPNPRLNKFGRAVDRSLLRAYSWSHDPR
jgi:hypothetical protein